MANWKKLASGAAGAAGVGGGLNVEDVFSTYLYEGNASTQTITNDIDLSTEGGMVWLKRRDGGAAHHLYDTERGATKRLRSDSTNAEDTQSNGLTAFNSDGFNIGSNPNINGGSTKNCSWTFRKAPKFFDVVTYTGNQSNRAIPHNLGCEVGMLIVKNITTGSTNWHCYHRGLTNANYAINLNQTGTEYSNSTFWQGTAPTSEVFYLGTNTQVNTTGDEYVAYLFAHNDGDGEFGPNGDQDIIKCGSYTGSGSTGHHVDLGFEPQWILVKESSASGDNWILMDSMRGLPGGTGTSYNLLFPNLSNAEASGTAPDLYTYIDATGFGYNGSSNGLNQSGETYIYIAIRRGPMAVPESATDVFDVTVYSGNSTADRLINTGFPVDLVTVANRSNSSASGARSTVWSRFVGPSKHLTTSSTSGEIDEAGSVEELYFDQNNGYRLGASTFQGLLNFSGYGSYVAWSWRRAPSFFDVVAYTGAYSPSGKTINHNLGVAPEMIWVKSRNATGNWYVYHANVSADPETDYLVLNEDDSLGDNIFWNDTAPTDTQFFVNGANNANGDIYVAYLFASLDGISKVGSYTGNGSSQTIDCGFSSGARFVLIKRTDISRDWYLWDSARGIVSGNDPHLSLNTTATEVTTDDSIDPSSSGFIVNQVGTLPGINVSSGSYVFYAIA